MRSSRKVHFDLALALQCGNAWSAQSACGLEGKTTDLVRLGRPFYRETHASKAFGFFGFAGLQYRVR
jgi:hypothetical protein